MKSIVPVRMDHVGEWLNLFNFDMDHTVMMRERYPFIDKGLGILQDNAWGFFK